MTADTEFSEQIFSRHEVLWLESLEHLAQKFSTCSKRQYAAVVLSPNNRVIGFGYNGAPSGLKHCIDGGCPRALQKDTPGAIYDNCVAQHAEAGALLWCDPAQRVGATIIVNGPPCMGCAKLIASSGVRRVVCAVKNEYLDWETVLDFLNACGVQVAQFPTV